MSKQRDHDPNVDISGMTLGQIDRLMDTLIRERVARMVKNNDPQYLITRALNEGFNSAGDPLAPIGTPGGFVVITSSVKDQSASKRRSLLHTIRLSEDDPDEWWSWDESAPTFVDTETVKVGNYRKTASVHMLNTHSLIIRHDIMWKNDERDRKSVRGYEVLHHFEPNGEISETSFSEVRGNVLRRLPPPPESGL